MVEGIWKKEGVEVYGRLQRNVGVYRKKETKYSILIRLISSLSFSLSFFLYTRSAFGALFFIIKTRMTAKSIPWPYYINDSTSTAAQHLNDSKKRKKRNRRSKSMFEWSLPIYNNATTTTTTTTCFSPAIMTVRPASSRRPRIEQQNQYSTLASNDEPSHVYVQQDDTDRCHTNDERENNNNGDFPSSSVDDEKKGLFPISTTTSTTASIFQRPLKNPLQNYYHNDDDDDDDDHQRNKLPIRTWSLKQQSINNSTMQCIQLFLTQFVKAFVSSGAPSHRLDTCTRLLLRKWNMAAQFGYFPGFMIISFENPYGTVSSTNK